MKRKILLFCLILISILQVSAASSISTIGVKEINQAQFKKLISDYDGGFKIWNFKGTRPAIIDFYATWCGPCQKLAPILGELQKEYKGKVDFYKLNIDENKELTEAYQISRIPMLLLIPSSGNPQIINGLYPKAELEETINYLFFPNDNKK